MGHRRTSLSARDFCRPRPYAPTPDGSSNASASRPATPEVPASALSGGNLQKLLIGRELAHEAPLLLVEQPTRGVDIGAIQNIHDQIVAYRDAGHAVLLVSAELGEIRDLADRVLVMYEGRGAATYTKDEADERALGLAMAGRAAAPTEAVD
ncbi:hypothetical protein ACRAWF_19540 [Streptomyces sp. L7]